MSEPTARAMARWEKIITAARAYGGIITVETTPPSPVLLPEREEEHLQQCCQVATELGIKLDESGDISDADCERMAMVVRERFPLWPAEREAIFWQSATEEVEEALEYAVATGRAVRVETGFDFSQRRQGEEG